MVAFPITTPAPDNITGNFALNFAQSSLQVSMIGIVVVGVFMISSLKMSTGALVACVILSGRVLSPLVQTGQLLTRLNGAMVAFKNVDKLIDALFKIQGAYSLVILTNKKLIVYE